MLTPLLRQQMSNSFVQCCWCWTHSATGWHDRRNKGGLLNLPHPLLIVPSLFFFMSLIHNSMWCRSIWAWVRIKNKYINKCTLKTTAPQTIGSDIQPGTVFHICGPVAKTLPRQRLQQGLDGHTGAHLVQQPGRDVPNTIVSNGGKPSIGARQGMRDSCLLAARAVWRYPGRCPSVTEAESVPKLSLC